jgi:cytochrome b561
LAQTIRTTKKGYGGVQIALHWLVAAGVGFNYLVSEGMEQAFDATVMGEGTAPDSLVPALHVWIGVAILVLVALRIVVRLTKGAPAPDAGLQGSLALWMHRVLYLLMAAVPLGGALTWFAGLEPLGDLHVLGANILIGLGGAHAVVALAHHFIVKDDTLRRMIRPN